MSFSCQKGEFDRFFNRLDRPVVESRPDRQPDRCRSTWPVSISEVVESKRVCLWSGKCELLISGRSNRTRYFQRPDTAAIFLPKELCCLGVMTWRWVPQTRYTLRRNVASLTKDLIIICMFVNTFATTFPFRSRKSQGQEL